MSDALQEGTAALRENLLGDLCEREILREDHAKGTLVSKAAKREKTRICDSCGAPAKYRCPSCRRESCSVECVKKHKEAHSCDGKKKPEAVPIESYNETVFFEDYFFLEKMQGVLAGFHRKLPSHQPFTLDNLPTPLHYLREAAKKRGLHLTLQSKGMQRRIRNLTRYIAKNDTILWRVDFVLHMGDGKTKEISRLVNERFRLSEVIYNVSLLREKKLQKHAVWNIHWEHRRKRREQMLEDEGQSFVPNEVEGVLEGTVKRWDDRKGYGFLALDGHASDVFVHRRELQIAGMASLIVGEKVKFDLEKDPEAGRGDRAVNVSGPAVCKTAELPDVPVAKKRRVFGKSALWEAPPVDPPKKTPSGRKACDFYWRSGACKHGDACNFEHLVPEGYESIVSAAQEALARDPLDDDGEAPVIDAGALVGPAIKAISHQKNTLKTQEQYASLCDDWERVDYEDEPASKQGENGGAEPGKKQPSSSTGPMTGVKRPREEDGTTGAEPSAEGQNKETTHEELLTELMAEPADDKSAKAGAKGKAPSYGGAAGEDHDEGRRFRFTFGDTLAGKEPSVEGDDREGDGSSRGEDEGEGSEYSRDGFSDDEALDADGKPAADASWHGDDAEVGVKGPSDPRDQEMLVKHKESQSKWSDDVYALRKQSRSPDVRQAVRAFLKAGKETGDGSGYKIFIRAGRLGNDEAYHLIPHTATLADALKMVRYVVEYPTIDLYLPLEADKIPLITEEQIEQQASRWNLQSASSGPTLKERAAELAPHELRRMRRIPCKYFAQRGRCNNGDDCLFLHTFELPYCKTLQNLGFCPLKERCFFSHRRYDPEDPDNKRKIPKDLRDHFMSQPKDRARDVRDVLIEIEARARGLPLPIPSDEPEWKRAKREREEGRGGHYHNNNNNSSNNSYHHQNNNNNNSSNNRSNYQGHRPSTGYQRGGFEGGNGGRGNYGYDSHHHSNQAGVPPPPRPPAFPRDAAGAPPPPSHPPLPRGPPPPPSAAPPPGGPIFSSPNLGSPSPQRPFQKAVAVPRNMPPPPPPR
ncbi:Cold shock protein CspA [Diplonema papillatum]|nr:Cold shock protein CspA [Diplonema papillatum]